MNSTTYAFDGLASEMAHASFGDERLSRRLVSSIATLSAKPSEGFPQIFKTPAELEGWYRFLRNPKVELEEILEPHIQATSDRASKEKAILILYDTTNFSFPLEEERREGLYKVNKHSQGFLGHFALAATLEKHSRPLGILGVKTFTRKDKGTGCAAMGVKPKRGLFGEKSKWMNLVKQASEELGVGTRAIHVMDSEADCYEIFEHLVADNYRFVIRCAHVNRRLKPKEKAKNLVELLLGTRRVCQRTVTLGHRRKHPFPIRRERHPKRKKRKAKLDFYAMATELPRMAHMKSEPRLETVKLNIVLVRERNCPSNEKPVEWVLFTKEKIDTPSEVAWVVDVYRKRWLIEEYFKSLKTGCAFEKRQLEPRKTLEAGLGVLVPIAWRLLLLKVVGRQTPASDATLVLSNLQIDILRSQSKKRMPHKLSTKRAMLEVAALGGHIKNNGLPGWIVLGRGLDNLLWMEVGWRSALEARKQGCDQS